MSAIKATYKKAAAAVGTTALVILNSAPALAVSEDQFKLGQQGKVDSGNNTKLNELLPNIAQNAINILLLVAGILAVVYLIWSGFLYITSAGNAEKAKSARNGIINTVIGIIVIVAAYWIINVAIGAGNTVNDSGGNAGGGGWF